MAQKKQQVLIVEDEESILELCTRILTQAGYGVEKAANYREAMEQAHSKKFDLVISDIKMPGKSGLDLLKDLRKEKPGLPSVIITGHGTMDAAMESLKLGVGGFVVKPFTSEELMAAIKNVLP